MQYSEREKTNKFDKLVEVLTFLRSPNGCAWDRAQDLQSVTRLLLDEVYEAIEAIEDNDLSLLAEELGDLLVLVIFSALLAREKTPFPLMMYLKVLFKKFTEDIRMFLDLKKLLPLKKPKNHGIE